MSQTVHLPTLTIMLNDLAEKLRLSCNLQTYNFAHQKFKNEGEAILTFTTGKNTVTSESVIIYTVQDILHQSSVVSPLVLCSQFCYQLPEHFPFEKE